MRKAVSSLFLLAVVFLILWAFSAWNFSNSTKEILNGYLSKENNKYEGSLFKGIEFDLIESKHSLFGSKLLLSVMQKKQNIFSQITQEFNEDLMINVDIVYGPLLFEKSGVSLGRSIWRVSLDDDSQVKLASKYSLSEQPKITFKDGFDDLINYELPIQTAISSVSISGSFNPQISEGQGKVIAKNLAYKSGKQSISAKEIALEYTYQTNSVNNTKLDWTSRVPELSYQHQAMSQPLLLEVSGDSSSDIQNDKLSVLNNYHFKQSKGTKYPIESGDIAFNVNDLSLISLRNIINRIENVSNLEQQAQWIFEEQGELPEGQDRMWELQDMVEQQLSTIPSLSKQLLKRKSNYTVSYNLDLMYKDKSSNLRGELIPLSYSEISRNGDDLKPVFSSLFKAVSKVNLDKALLAYVSSHLPITKSKFELIYNQNKLLMQQ